LRVLYEDNSLYTGDRLFDPPSDSIFKELSRRDHGYFYDMNPGKNSGTWQFSSGLNVMNNTYNPNDMSILSNFFHTPGLPQTNNISIKISYYLDNKYLTRNRT